MAGMLSLLLLPKVTRFDSNSSVPGRGDLDAIRRDLESGDAAAAENRLISFLATHAAGPTLDEARILLARATLAQAQAGVFPGLRSMNRAWDLLTQAPRSADTRRLLREDASLLAEFGLVREGVGRFGELYAESPEPDLALEYAAALMKQAALEPEIRHAHLDAAAAKISDFLRLAPPGQRARGIAAQAALYRESRRAEEALQNLASELAETRDPASRGLLILERGLTFDHLGRNMEAMASFDDAEKLLADPLLRGAAQVHQAVLYARESNPECLEVSSRIIAAGSPAAPLARLVVGVHELGKRSDSALDALRGGFSQIRRPRLAGDARFDLGWVIGALRAAADRETDSGRLGRFAAVYAEIGRLRPLSVGAGFDHAAILLRAGRFLEAADRFLAAGESERAMPEDRERAVLAAADACAEGRLHRRAASLYREYYELRPASHAAALFHRAGSLRNAGDAAAAQEAFEEYVSKAGPSGTFTGAALLEKAALQMADRRDTDALGTYDRILKAREVATSPARDDWASALLGRCRALLRLSRTADARKSLGEYLERYAEGPSPAPQSLEAARLLIDAAIAEGEWKAGLARLRDLDLLAARMPERDRAPYAERLKEARFLEGELQLSLEDNAAAFQTFGEAGRRSSSPEDRLWGLVGRARALARLERKEEARRDYSDARTILDSGTGMAGLARDYWKIALDSLAREVK